MGIGWGPRAEPLIGKCGDLMGSGGKAPKLERFVVVTSRIVDSRNS